MLVRWTMVKVDPQEKGMLAVTTGAMNADFVCWHEFLHVLRLARACELMLDASHDEMSAETIRWNPIRPFNPQIVVQR